MDIISAARVIKSDDIDEAVNLYVEMIKSMKRVEELKVAGISGRDEQVRFYKLEVKVNSAFKRLDAHKQRVAVEILVSKGFMSQGFLNALLLFGGRITKM